MSELGLMVADRGGAVSNGFGSQQIERRAETASQSMAARQQAIIQARFVMSERHPRSWEGVRVRLLQHCERPGFAEVARYSKPAGKAFINGAWVEQRAEGLSARFAEVARQEMANVEAFSSIVYEDDLVRIVSAGVSDIERNSHESREITIAKAVEKKGKRNRNNEWNPPEGRELVTPNPRINSYGDPVWLVKATDDEIRSKQNSEISKVQRDATLRLIPKDIRDDAESRVVATLADPKKIDPGAARKKVVDAFASLGVMPEDLTNYIATELPKISPAQLNELRMLYTAIKDGEVTFQEALAAKFGKDDEEPGTSQAQSEVAERKIAEMQQKQADREKKSEMPKPAEEEDRTRQDKPLTAEENAELNRQAAEQSGDTTQAKKPFVFGGKK